MYFLFLLLFLFLPTTAHAQQVPTNAITVSPAIIRLDLAVDKPETTIFYTNSSDKTVELQLSASDFAELEHGYKPAFLDEKNAQNYQYSLSSWITFEKQTLVLAPKETKEITVFINQERLTPGGHYGSILAQLTNVSSEDTVQIQGALSSLLFVRTATGTEKESGTITTFSPEQSWIDFPKRFVLRFQNTGNTDVIPYGLVEIKDIFGRIVAKGILNEGSLISLPESIRRYDIELEQTEKILFPGQYHATFTGHFGKTNQKMEIETNFWSEGNVPIVPISIVLGIIVGIIIWRKKNS